MRLPRTLWLLVLREVCTYAAIGLFAFGGVFVLQNLLRQLEDLLGLGVRMGDALALFGAVALFLAGYVLPIALLFGVLAALGQFAANSEVKALRASGVSLAQLAAPVFALALAVSAATWFLLARAEPSARRRLVDVAIEVASRGGLIQPGVLSALDRAGERIVLVDAIDGAGRLHGVFVSDRTDPARPFVVAAREGEFALDAATRTAHLRLREGDLHIESAQERASASPRKAAGDESQRVTFRALDYAFDVSAVKLLSQLTRPREMSEAELLGALAHFDRTGEPPPGVREATRAEYEIQLERRRALPLAPLVFAALGVPLALRQAGPGRSRGAMICAAIAIAYYVALSAAEYLAKETLLAPGIALWLPNAAFGALALWLLKRARGVEA